VCCLAFLPFSWAIASIGGVMGLVGLVLGFVSRSMGNRAGMSVGAISTSAIAVLFAIIAIVLPIAFGTAIMATKPDGDNLDTSNNGNAPKSKIKDAKVGDAKIEPAIDIGNGAKVDREFLDNPIAAERKWFGKRVRMHHGVDFIGRDGKNEFYISGQFGGFLYPAPAELKRFEALKIGDEVIVEGTISEYERDGFQIRLTLRDVKLIEILKSKR
jgi:hypothetical protein